MTLYIAFDVCKNGGCNNFIVYILF